MQPLYQHQKDIVELSKKYPNVGLLWDCGTGKTRGLIEILRSKYTKEGRILKTLILCPLITILNWEEEIKKFSNIPGSSILTLEKNGIPRINAIIRRAIIDPDSIWIMNYEALRSDRVFTEIHKWRPDIVVCDELHKIKSYSGVVAKKVVAIGDNAKFRYGLTGTPILNSIADVFMQFRFLDKGETFGKYFFSFRSTYMIDANANSPWLNYPDWIPNPRMFNTLQEKISKITSRVTKKECLDLPPLVEVSHYYEMSMEQSKAYAQMKRDFIAEVRTTDESDVEYSVAKLAMIKGLRLMQISSGFIPVESGEEKEFKSNPRLEALTEIIESIDSKHKVIVWCSFIKNYAQVGQALTNAKIGHTYLHGGLSQREKVVNMDAFKKDDMCRVLIANRASAGIGINLVEASYSVVYSRNFSLEQELQSESRNHRGGSEIHDKITKINLIAKGSLDEPILNALKGKQEISNVIIDHMELK